jgi:hypothetical protein
MKELFRIKKVGLLMLSVCLGLLITVTASMADLNISGNITEKIP